MLYQCVYQFREPLPTPSRALQNLNALVTVDGADGTADAFDGVMKLVDFKITAPAGYAQEAKFTVKHTSADIKLCFVAVYKASGRRGSVASDGEKLGAGRRYAVPRSLLYMLHEMFPVMILNAFCKNTPSPPPGSCSEAPP